MKQHPDPDTASRPQRDTHDTRGRRGHLFVNYELGHIFDATEPYEPVIDYSDDDDYAFIDDSDRDYQ